MVALQILERSGENETEILCWGDDGNPLCAEIISTQGQEGGNRIAIRAVNRVHPIRGANKGSSLAQVRDQVCISENGLRRIRTPISSTRVDGDQIIVGEEPFGLDQDGLRSMCNEISAPCGYLGQLDLDLRNRNLEFGLKAIGQGKSGLKDNNSVVIVRDGHFRSFGRSDLFHLPGVQVLDAVQDGLGMDSASFRVENFALRNEHFALDLVSERIATEVRPGDIVEAGIHVEHSLVGDKATLITAFVLRLMCMNGNTRRECVGSRKNKRTRRLPNDHDNAADLQYTQIKGLVLK